MAVTCSTSMGECRRAKSEVTISDSSFMHCDAVRTDISKVEDCTNHLTRGPVPSGYRDHSSVSCGEQETTNKVAAKATKMNSAESTRGTCANNGLHCGSTGFVKGTHSYEVPDELRVPSCGQEIMSAQMNVLPTCCSQQTIWACEAFARTSFRRVPCLQGHPIQHDVRAEFVLRTNRGKWFEWAESPDFVLWSDIHARLFTLLHNHVKYGTRLVWDAIT